MRPVLKRCNKGKEHVKASSKREHKNVDIGQANRARTAKEVNGSLLLLLPMHLIFDILARLPISTLFIINCVCNTFNSILRDPYFLQLRLAKASGDDNCLVIQDGNDPSKMFLTPLLDLDKHALHPKAIDHCNYKFFSWQTLTMPSLAPKTNSSTCLIGSCNGLVCLKYFEHKDKAIRFCVCNPILGEFTFLPRFWKFASEYGGFGFCPKTKQYKVLRLIYEYRSCDILTLGTDDEWRRIDSPPHPARIDDIGCSYKGNLHWIVESKKLICSFNLETERYSYISLPKCFDNTVHKRFIPPYIGTLDGLFCVSLRHVPCHFEAYVMEVYGAKESWTKRVSIDIGFNFEQISAIKFLDNGVLVLHRRPDHLIYYDTRKGTTLDILVEGIYDATIHIPSLTSLKDIVRRENVEQVERKMLHIFSSKANKGQRKKRNFQLVI